MNANIINASRGVSKDKRSWLRLSYTVGGFNGASDRVGLRLAHSFVAEDHQQEVWEALGTVADFPVAADLAVATANGRTVEIVGIELSP